MDNVKMKDYLEGSQQQWDEEYKTGAWDYLSDITEFSRYSTVYGYVRKLVAEEGILDMGCGTGILYDLLLDSEKKVYTGVDLSQEAIKIATDKSPEHTFYCGDILTYVPQKQYDVMIFNESLHYVTNTSSVLLRYSNYLTQNGVIITSLYSHKDTTDLAFSIIENKIEEIEQCGLFEVLDKVTIFNHKAGLKWYIHLLKKV
ncbi:MAG TPA: class I SAM-dependent methyltransferase [Paenibacillus sp.]